MYIALGIDEYIVVGIDVIVAIVVRPEYIVVGIIVSSFEGIVVNIVEIII